MQVRGAGPHHDRLPDDGDAPVGEGVPHVVASLPSGDSTRNRLLCPQEGNSVMLESWSGVVFEVFDFTLLLFL